MKTRILSMILLLPVVSSAQKQTAKVGAKVKQVEVRDSDNKPIKLPCFGEKHLLIFYPDPDHANQNKEFTDYLEDNHIVSDSIYSFGIVNLKDAPLFPNPLVRSIIRMKEKKNDVKIYTDPDYILRDAWGLGDVNNKFVIIFITKDKEIAFLKIGKMTEKDIKTFFSVIEKYR